MKSLQRDVTGERFGRLLVLRDGGRYWRASGSSLRAWVCLCDCGDEVTVNSHSLLRGLTQSCGCLRVAVGREIGRSGLGARARWRAAAPVDASAALDLADALGYFRGSGHHKDK